MASQSEDDPASGPQSFTDRENNCKRLFNRAVEKYGPFWHICTPGNLSEIINTNDADYKFAVSNMAISAAESDIVVVTDAHMETHFHGLLGGPLERCLDCAERYTFRLAKHLESTDRRVNLSEFRCDNPILITDLDMMRNEIAYINRNGFVDDSRFLPFSYPWGGGYLYFNPAAQRESGTPYNEIPFRLRREMCCRRVSAMPDRYVVKDGMILPSSYTNYRLGEAMFRDAHHYFNALTRNVEAYSEEAKRLGDLKVLGREEMYPVTQGLSKKKYGEKQPSKLSYDAKLDIARTMHYDFHASNNQIRSILGLSEYQVNTLFPLSKSNK